MENLDGSLTHSVATPSILEEFQAMTLSPRMVVRMECSGLQCGRRPASLHGKVGEGRR